MAGLAVEPRRALSDCAGGGLKHGAMLGPVSHCAFGCALFETPRSSRLSVRAVLRKSCVDLLFDRRWARGRLSTRSPVASRLKFAWQHDLYSVSKSKQSGSPRSLPYSARVLRSSCVSFLPFDKLRALPPWTA